MTLGSNESAVTGWWTYVIAQFKSNSLLTRRKVFSGCKMVLSLVNEITRKNDSPSRRCRRGKLYWVGLRIWDPRIRQRKLSFQRWGTLALLLIGRSPYRRFERDAGRPGGEVVDGGHRSWKIGISYLPVVATKTACLYEGLCLTKS